MTASAMPAGQLIESLGHTCIVVAPSRRRPVPKKAGERVKTNRSDAEGLAKLLRAGELTAVWGLRSSPTVSQ